MVQGLPQRKRRDPGPPAGARISLNRYHKNKKRASPKEKLLRRVREKIEDKLRKNL